MEIGADALLTANGDRFADIAARYRIACIMSLSQFAVGGGLMSYGASISAATKLAAGYVAKLLKGARPSDLPIIQSESFEFAINLKTARALNLRVPASLLARANQVIE